jgi:hypothetical protein
LMDRADTEITTIHMGCREADEKHIGTECRAAECEGWFHGDVRKPMPNEIEFSLPLTAVISNRSRDCRERASVSEKAENAAATELKRSSGTKDWRWMHQGKRDQRVQVRPHETRVFTAFWLSCPSRTASN